MKKIGICGHFTLKNERVDGQIIKTKLLSNLFEINCNAENVLKIDTYGGIKAFPRIILKSFKLFKECQQIVILPAQNGVCTLMPVFVLINLFFKKKLSYIVIGGWLDKMIEKKCWLLFFLKQLEGIYVETTIMKQALEKKNLKNIKVLPNPKTFELISKNEISEVKEPVSLCFFSRVIKEKGIEDAINAVKQINFEEGNTKVVFDIYGNIGKEYTNEFSELEKEFPEYIKYCGAAPSEQAVSILKNYDLQLFPTKFATEGIPGSIIDGYFAAVPVLAARWESFSDVVDEGITGIGFELGNYDDFLSELKNAISQPEKLMEMKYGALNRAVEYKKECIQKIREYFV